MSSRKPLTLIKSASLALVLTLVACRTAPPKVDLTIWAGDSKNEGFTRAQEGKTISCKDPAIDELAGISYKDVKKLFDLLWSCQAWPKGMKRMQGKEIDDALELYQTVSKKMEAKK